VEIQPYCVQRDAGRCHHTTQRSTLVFPWAAAPVAAAPLLPPKDPECLSPRCPGPAGTGCSAVRLGDRDWLKNPGWGSLGTPYSEPPELPPFTLWSMERATRFPPCSS
jgi:hypothetical protein